MMAQVVGSLTPAGDLDGVPTSWSELADTSFFLFISLCSSTIQIISRWWILRDSLDHCFCV